MKARGFTLVEVTVAIAVLALVAALGWRGIDGIVRARDASRERLDASLRLNTVIAQWEHDLAALQSVPDVPPLAWDGRALRLTRRAEGGVQVVAWALTGAEAGGGAGARTWQRWAGAPVTSRNALQEQWLASQQLVGNEAGQIRALEGVGAWTVYYWRGNDNAWSGAGSSADVAPTPDRGSSAPAASGEVLPRGVRLQLTFDAAPFAGTLTRDVVLGPQSP